MKTLYLIDGFAQLFRAYHAIRSNLSSPVTREPTNATFGWVGMLLRIYREYQPDYLAVVIDVSGDRESFRSEIYPDYKANRDAPPMDFHPQVERSIEICKLFNIPVLGVERYEADDVIATLVRELSEANDDLRIRIVSKDKDLEQLLSDRVEMFDVHKDEFIDVAALEEKKGIRPEHVRDVLALAGDSVDNVPGVPGIGPKTAAKLISKYGNIDTLYEHIEEIKGKQRERLEESREAVQLSRRLVTLDDQVDVSLDLGSARVDESTFDNDEILETLRILGFNRYQDEFRDLVGLEAPEEAPDSNRDSPTPSESSADQESDAAGTLFAAPNDAQSTTTDSNSIPSEPKRGKYTCITDEDELRNLIAEIKQAGRISIDTETTGLSPMTAKMCGISIAISDKTGFYIPVRSPNPKSHLNEKQVLDLLGPVVEDASIAKVGQNLKYDWIIFKRHGVQLNGIAGDSMIAAFLVDAARSSYSMDALAEAYLDYRCIPISALIGKRARGVKQKTFDEINLDFAAPYAAEDADVSLRLVNLLESQVKALGLDQLYREIEIPLIEVLASMQYRGIRVDEDTLESQRHVLMRRIAQIKDDIVKEAPREFNPDSPKQLATVLFNDPDDEDAPGLGLKVIKRGKTGPSTDIEVLEKLTADPEVTTRVPELILDYRQLTKLVNTYLVALRESIFKETGRVHASFNQTGAATGRLSSNDPNLQNIPIRTDVGRQIRKAFVADSDHKLITADYSQVELRLLAHLSQDAALVEAFQSGEDIHRTVAAQVFNVKPEDVSSEQRGSAKMVNFGIVYGITPFGLARRLGGEVEDAAKIIESYKERFKGIQKFLEACVEQARNLGYVETIMKRRRPVPQVNSRNPRERMFGERIAINSVVQGSAADLVKIAMVRLFNTLPEKFPRTNMLLQIHDELVFEAPDEEISDALSFIVDVMEHALDLTVPLVVNAESSQNWLEAK